MDKMSWKGMKVLVTGANGFIGSHLAKVLIEKKAEVTTIINNKKKIGNIEILNLKGKINIIHGDIISIEDCKKAFSKYDIDFCFHIAAQAIVGYADINPLPTFESNIKGTWNVLEACRLSKNIKGVIIASSDRVYGQQKNIPFTENSPLNGYSPYDTSKICAEIISKCYFSVYNLPLAIARNANTYGPADMNLSRIIPNVITKLIRNEHPAIIGDESHKRDYLYIKDAVNAYLKLAENLHKNDVRGEAFNFGTKSPISALELYNKIIRLMGKGIKPKILETYEVKEKNGFGVQSIDSSKARKILGWKPEYGLDRGLKETIEWYKIYLSK